MMDCAATASWGLIAATAAAAWAILPAAGSPGEPAVDTPAAAGRDTYTNPVGEGLLMGDPFVARYGGTYYLTGTTDAGKGFRLVVCPWKNAKATGLLLDCAARQHAAEMLGVLQTSWCDSGAVARYLLGDESVEGVPRMVGESFNMAMARA